MTLYGSIQAFQEISNNLPLVPISQRVPNVSELFRQNNDKLAGDTRVAMPAQVVSWNASQQTIVAQPLIREKIVDKFNGTLQWQQIAPIPDVPVMFPQAGGFVLTMPITPGDEVLLVFNDLSIDSWWTSGGIQNWIDRRRHDLSDAIAIPGINSVPNVISSIATNGAELRTKDDTVKVHVGTDNVTLTAGSNSIVLNSTGIQLNGTLTINGHQYLLHTHGGVQSGSSFTAPVTP